MSARLGALARAAVAWTAHPALVVLALAWAARAQGHRSPLLVAAGPLAAAVAIAVLLERVLPYRRDWWPRAAQARQDLAHNLVSTLGVTAATRAALAASAPLAAAALAARAGGPLWPGHWPLPAQLALALVVKELPYYAAHRWLHSSTAGWRLHELHHDSERLYSMSSGRTHPLNVALTYGLPQLPLLLAGAPEALLVQVGVFMGVHGLLQHSNIAFRYGWLNAVFATAEIHRHHHSRRLEDSRENLGHNLMVWDHVFGTWRWPRTAGLEVGVEGSTVPPTFLGQLAAPLRRRAR